MTAPQRLADPFHARDTFDTGAGRAGIYRLSAAGRRRADAASPRCPIRSACCWKSVLRNCDGYRGDRGGRAAIWPAGSRRRRPRSKSRSSRPGSCLQDFTGVPAVVDLAAMRSAMKRLGGDPKKINPLMPVDLVIDHSVQVDRFGSPDALDENVELEFERNRERYEFLRWGQKAFDNFRVVPPAVGIVHQVNLEYLAKCVFLREDDAGPGRLARHARRHRQPHDDDQRPGRGRLGRRRHRGRGRHARPAALHARCPR